MPKVSKNPTPDFFNIWPVTSAEQRITEVISDGFRSATTAALNILNPTSKYIWNGITRCVASAPKVTPADGPVMGMSSQLEAELFSDLKKYFSDYPWGNLKYPMSTVLFFLQQEDLLNQHENRLEHLKSKSSRTSEEQLEYHQLDRTYDDALDAFSDTAEELEELIPQFEKARDHFISNLSEVMSGYPPYFWESAFSYLKDNYCSNLTAPGLEQLSDYFSPCEKTSKKPSRLQCSQAQLMELSQFLQGYLNDQIGSLSAEKDKQPFHKFSNSSNPEFLSLYFTTYFPQIAFLTSDLLQETLTYYFGLLHPQHAVTVCDELLLYLKNFQKSLQSCVHATDQHLPSYRQAASQLKRLDYWLKDQQQTFEEKIEALAKKHTKPMSVTECLQRSATSAYKGLSVLGSATWKVTKGTAQYVQKNPGKAALLVLMSGVVETMADSDHKLSDHLKHASPREPQYFGKHDFISSTAFSLTNQASSFLNTALSTLNSWKHHYLSPPDGIRYYGQRFPRLRGRWEKHITGERPYYPSNPRMLEGDDLHGCNRTIIKDAVGRGMLCEERSIRPFETAIFSTVDLFNCEKRDESGVLTYCPTGEMTLYQFQGATVEQELDWISFGKFGTGIHDNGFFGKAAIEKRGLFDIVINVRRYYCPGTLDFQSEIITQCPNPLYGQIYAFVDVINDPPFSPNYAVGKFAIHVQVGAQTFTIITRSDCASYPDLTECKSDSIIQVFDNPDVDRLVIDARLINPDTGALEELPAGSDLNPVSGKFTSVTSSGEQTDLTGPRMVRVTVNDGYGGILEMDVPWYIDNESPVTRINPVDADPIYAADGTRSLKYAVNTALIASDSDGDELSVAILVQDLNGNFTTILPQGMLFDPNLSRITWIPTLGGVEDPRSREWILKLEICDPFNACIKTTSFKVTVLNDAPELKFFPPIEVNSQASICVPAPPNFASDRESDAITLKLAQITGSSAFAATIDADTGEICVTAERASGRYFLEVTATDDAPIPAESEPLTVQVDITPPPPKIIGVPAVISGPFVGESFSWNPLIGDDPLNPLVDDPSRPDTDRSGLRVVSVSNLPDGLTLNHSTGLIEGTPSEATTGDFAISVTVQNEGGKETYSTIIRVPERAPIISLSSSEISSNVNSDESFNIISASSADAYGVEYSLIGSASGEPKPDWISINPSTGAIRIKDAPNSAQGTNFKAYNIQVVATHLRSPELMSSSKTLSVLMNNRELVSGDILVDGIPISTSGTLETSIESKLDTDTQIDLSVGATDLDDPNALDISIGVTGKPEFCHRPSGTKILFCNPSARQQGVFPIQVTYDDSHGSFLEKGLTVIVPGYDPNILDLSDSDLAMTKALSRRLSIKAEDPNGIDDIVSIEVTNLPAIQAYCEKIFISAAQTDLICTPTQDDYTFPIRVRATDSTGKTAEHEWVATVAKEIEQEGAKWSDYIPAGGAIALLALVSITCCICGSFSCRRHRNEAAHKKVLSYFAEEKPWKPHAVSKAHDSYLTELEHQLRQSLLYLDGLVVSHTDLSRSSIRTLATSETAFAESIGAILDDFVSNNFEEILAPKSTKKSCSTHTQLPLLEYQSALIKKTTTLRKIVGKIFDPSHFDKTKLPLLLSRTMCCYRVLIHEVLRVDKAISALNFPHTPVDIYRNCEGAELLNLHIAALEKQRKHDLMTEMELEPLTTIISSAHILLSVLVDNYFAMSEKALKKKIKPKRSAMTTDRDTKKPDAKFVDIKNPAWNCDDKLSGPKAISSERSAKIAWEKKLVIVDPKRLGRLGVTAKKQLIDSVNSLMAQASKANQSGLWIQLNILKEFALLIKGTDSTGYKTYSKQCCSRITDRKDLRLLAQEHSSLTVSAWIPEVWLIDIRWEEAHSNPEVLTNIFLHLQGPTLNVYKINSGISLMSSILSKSTIDIQNLAFNYLNELIQKRPSGDESDHRVMIHTLNNLQTSLEIWISNPENKSHKLKDPIKTLLTQIKISLAKYTRMGNMGCCHPQKMLYRVSSCLGRNARRLCSGKRDKPRQQIAELERAASSRSTVKNPKKPDATPGSPLRAFSARGGSLRTSPSSRSLSGLSGTAKTTSSPFRRASNPAYDWGLPPPPPVLCAPATPRGLSEPYARADISPKSDSASSTDGRSSESPGSSGSGETKNSLDSPPLHSSNPTSVRALTAMEPRDASRAARVSLAHPKR